jgi:hypothetical protein
MQRAVEILRHSVRTQHFEQESSIHKLLNHPLIVDFEQYIRSMKPQQAIIVPWFVPNRSLADYFSSEIHSKHHAKENKNAFEPKKTRFNDKLTSVPRTEPTSFGPVARLSKDGVESRGWRAFKDS